MLGRLALVGPGPLTGDPVDPDSRDVAGRRIGHRWKGHVRSNVGVGEALEKLRCASLGDSRFARTRPRSPACRSRFPRTLRARAQRVGRGGCCAPLRWRKRCPETISSSSIPIQTTVTCGLPSELRVTRWARGPDSISSRTDSGSEPIPIKSTVQSSEKVLASASGTLLASGLALSGRRWQAQRGRAHGPRASGAPLAKEAKSEPRGVVPALAVRGVPGKRRERGQY
jgi:hypothetical protein